MVFTARKLQDSKEGGRKKEAESAATAMRFLGGFLVSVENLESTVLRGSEHGPLVQFAHVEALLAVPTLVASTPGPYSSHEHFHYHVLCIPSITRSRV